MLDRRRRLTDAELDRLAAALYPRSRIVSSAPLLGGLDWGTYALDLEGPRGSRALVLRRFDDPDRGLAAAARLWAALTALQGTDLPVPRPVLRDDGPLVGAPAVVMTRCDGAIRPPPPGSGPWIEAYTRALAMVHTTDLGALTGPLPSCADPRVELDRFLAHPASADARAGWDRVAAALVVHVERVDRPRPVLRHRDFWFGNTLWVGDRVTGIVDWSGACLGDARGDVAYARLDMQLVLGTGGAASFQSAYERNGSGPLDLAWWELLAAVDGLAWLPDWVDGYREVGVDMSVAAARERLDDFIEDAMARLTRDGR